MNNEQAFRPITPGMSFSELPSPAYAAEEEMQALMLPPMFDGAATEPAAAAAAAPSPRVHADSFRQRGPMVSQSQQLDNNALREMRIKAAA